MSPLQCTPPSLHPGLLGRPRVLGLLAAADTPVVLVTAGAGFGKTTAIAQWAATDERPLAWLTLGPHDDDPVVFVRAVVHSLSGVVPMPEVVDAVRQPSPRLVDRVLPLLESALVAAPEPFLWVLDDLEAVSDPAAMEHLDRILDVLGPGSTVVLASRSDPPLGMARRILDGTLTELGVGDLALTDDEAHAMLATAAPGLGAGLRAEVVERVDGWPAGVQLAGLAVRARPDPRSVRRALSGEGDLLTEYLRQEVLDGLDDGDRDFLLRTAALERLSGEVCDAVLGSEGSADRLAHLSTAAHTFVLPLRDSGVYRYHALFRDMLLSAALHRIPDEVDRVRRRAVEWYRDHGEGRAAVDQALATADPDLAAEATYAELAEMIHQGELATLERWLARFPDRTGHRDDIRLALCEGWLALMQGRREDLRRWLAIAEAHVGDDGPMSDGSASRTVAVAALRMIAAIGGSKEVLDCARLIRDAGPDGSPYWATAGVIAGVQEHVLGLAPDVRDAMEGPEFDARGVPAPHAVALCHLSFGAFQRGATVEGDRLLREALEEVEEHALGDYPMVAIVHCVRAYAEALHGATERSAEAAGHADELLSELAEVTDRGQIQLRLVLAEAALLRDDTAAAETELAMAEDRLFREPDAVVLHEWVDDLRGRVDRRTRRPPVPALTPAEQRVLQQLATHRSQAEIGEHLYVSRNTVKSHTLSVYRKLGVAGRSQAVEQARLLGLLDRPEGDQR